jgi:transcriptional regulator with XRE-family HTH domain
VAKESADKLKARVGSRISEIRRGQGLSQEQVAHHLGVRFQWISRVERGTENVTIETLAAIANALDARVIQLFEESKPDPNLRKRAPKRKTRSKT